MVGSSAIFLVALLISIPNFQSGMADSTEFNGTKASLLVTTATTDHLGHFIGKVIGLSVAAVMICVFLGLATCYFFGDRRKFHRDTYCDQITTNPVRYDELRLLAESKDALDLRGLRKETAKIGAMQKKRMFGRPGTAMLRYLHSISDEAKEKQDEKCQHVVEVPDCRVPKLLVRRDTQVTVGRDQNPESQRACLHMNRLFDYHGNTVILCQSPTPNQFNDHWMAIYQEKVGTVVWVGPLKEKGKVKIDPYISLDKDGTMVCGAFSMRTDREVEGHMDESQGYNVTATRGEDRRTIIFIHISSWPDDLIPSEREIEKLVIAVGYVRSQHRNQAKLEHPLPTIMVHCSMGVERSAGFVAVYLGNQMWLDAMKVNVIGILRFVRRQRWKAFGMGEADVQVRLVFLVLEAIATYYNEPGSCPFRKGKITPPGCSPKFKKGSKKSAGLIV